MNLWTAISEVISHPDFTNTLGWLLAVSMVVGAVLNDGGRRMLSWSAAIISSTLLTELARWYYWSLHNNTAVSIQGSGITVVCVTINVVGMFLGWLITYIAKKRARHERVCKYLPCEKIIHWIGSIRAKRVPRTEDK